MCQRVVIKGEIDLAVAPELLWRIEAAIDADPGGRVEVDFSRVSFIDSTGLGVLVTCRRRARGRGGDLSVVNVPDRVRSVFGLTGLDRVLLRSPRSTGERPAVR